MLPSKPFLISLLFLLMLHRTTSHLGSGPHIADVNILLPPKMTHPVEYRLQGSDGCFKWSWDHHDILAVLPEYNSSSHCSTSARLKSIAPYGGRKETAVYATDLNTGMVIRCKVYIDLISRIQIFHNSVKLDLGGLATLRVRAFDSEDNVFSSLVGLQFTWQLTPETLGSPHSLVHVPLKDSPLGDCGGFCGDLDIQVKLEESGVFSDLYVVKGTEIGHEIVYVNLVEPPVEYLADKIGLTVAEAMSLDPPSPVYVLIGAVVKYNLKVIRNNTPHEVSLPSQFHQWSVMNSSVAQVDQALGTVHALSLGVTTVVVEDTRVVGHMQISSFHVVLPDNLLLFMSPLSPSGDHIEGVKPIPSVSRWYVVAGRLYLIHVKVFSAGPGAPEIFITESDEVELHDNQDEYWNILPVSEGTTTKRNYRFLNANSYGLGKLTATLAYSTGHDIRKEVLKVVQEVMECDQVKFVMEGDSGVSKRILLPWVPGVYQELELKASGGCAMSSSDYKWFSSDMAVVSVSVSGIVQAKKPGKTTIRAVSVFDSLNYDELVIEVSIPSSMVMLPNFPVETPVGLHLQASVTLKASTGAYFYACDAFRSFIRWKTESDSFIIVNGTEEFSVSDKHEAVELHSSFYGPPCAWTRIYASSSGRTVLHATLTRDKQQYDHISREAIVLKASSCIAAYSPLIVHQLSDGNQFGGYWFDVSHTESQNKLRNLDHLYLVPGTHLDVMLRGGPERWGKDVEFIENVEVLNEQASYVKDGIFTHQMSTSYGNPYRIQCQSLGTFKLIFRRGNLMGEDHHLPAVSEARLLLVCGFPSSIVVLDDEALNAPQIIQSAAQAERMPGGIRASPVTVANGRTIRISAVGLSDTGKAFANSSSLSLRWELVECQGLALFDDVYSSTTYSSWERFLVLQNASGLCIVRSTVVGFIDSLKHLDFAVMSESYVDPITDAVQLQLVSSLRISPEFSLLFFSPEARLNISITGGSCFIETQVNDTQIVEVIQQIPAYECSQLMLAPKSLGSALVTVHDIGLVPPLAASSTVQVAEMDWIKILSGEHISIVEGSSQSINFMVGVGDGRIFDPSQYIYMSIRVLIEENIVEVVEENYDFPIMADKYVHGPNFTLQAIQLGVTTIYLSAVQPSGHEILSQPVKVEVYAPPSIHPSDIFLVPGASYVITIRGGPKIGSHIQYASMDDQTAKIDKFSGRLSAISPGNSTLVATIYGDGGIMLSQAYGKVKVGIPSSAVLNVQNEQLAVGCRMPIYPSLSEGNLFSFYELCNNFKWTVENKDVLNFHGANHVPGTGHSTLKTFQATDSLEGQDLYFIRVLHGISAGKTNVTVSFSCHYNLPNSFTKSMFYSASISLWVVPDLPLALGSPITWILPPYYISSDILPSSSHVYNKGDPLGDKGIAYSLLGQHKRKTEEVRDDDINIDGAKIITKDAGSLACIQAKDRSTERTEVASCVRVAEVAQIRIMTNEFPVHMLPVGAELDLPIKYHDTLGNPFHEAHNITLFEVVTNYPDVVSIDAYDGHGYVHLEAKSQGTALVQIAFVSNPRKSVYAVISVGPQLYPQNPVVPQGTGLSFDIKGLRDSASGQWFSGNESVVFVERLSGKAEAIGEGTAHVHFESSNCKLHTTVTVLKGHMVSVDAPGGILTNVPFPAKGYAFSVKSSDAHNHHHEASGNNMLFLFECAVDPPNIGFAKLWKDLDTGNSYCLFFPYSPEHLARSASNLGDTLQQVSVSVRASLMGDHNVSGSASAPFVGGFSILEMDKSSKHLNLSRDSNKSVITIIGNTDVQLHWHDKSRLSVRPIHGGDPAVGKSMQYEVTVYGAESFQDQLIFSLPATGQRVEIDVSYDPEEREAVIKPANVTLWAGVSSLLFLLILTVSFVICYLDRPDRSRPPVPSSVRSIAAPVTPERSSPAVINDQSPRTPQPFIDYVRRTLDETPYYRQDFRRRVNPQNTF
ncbi:Nuclear pore complex, gp210 component [Handroanthus impetiginosus]|uniref:Nuclear pore complex, gp210 component n=1 Tax=Handroanthus impetiginosus TaxID=429701 RepID=A0A2G9G7B4_9LAMI|nr:Nuclear pore complex, gp210 component [Handroanthus impetiginosus]